MEYYSEKVLEPRLKEEVELLGGLCMKFTSPGNRGVNDRLIIMPGFVEFVEVKSTGKKPDPLQLVFHRKLERRRHKAWVIDTMPKLTEFIEYLKNKLNDLAST